jgi:hypothetical protein
MSERVDKTDSSTVRESFASIVDSLLTTAIIRSCIKFAVQYLKRLHQKDVEIRKEVEGTVEYEGER